MAYHTLSAQDQRDFLKTRGTKRVRPHQMSKKILAWAYCANCGLMALKNDVSRTAVSKQCVTWED